MSNGHVATDQLPYQRETPGVMVAAERRMAPEQIEHLLLHLLRIPSLLEAASAQLRPDMFSPAGEDHFALLWAAAVALMSASGQCNVQALHAELASQSSGNPDLVAQCQLLLGRDGLIARIASTSADQLSEEAGRQLLQRFLIERSVVNDIQHQFYATYESGGYPRQLPALLRRAAEQIDQIESVTSAQPRLRIVTDAEFAAGNYSIEWHVRGLLAKGQPCIVGGPAKSLKTSLMLDLAISIANGFECDFLNYPPFRCSLAPVLFISAEMGHASLQDARRRIVATKGLQGRPVRMHWCFDAPRLSDDGDMRFLRRQIETLNIKIVFLDPLYLMLLAGSAGVSAANLYEMGPLLRKISKVCLDGGATPIYLHHFNRQGALSRDPPTLEDLSFAGVAEFARQWILLKRREPYVGGTGDHKLWLAAGGSAGHSGLWAVDVAEGVMDISEGVMGAPGGRRWQVTVSSAPEYRQDARAQRQARQQDAARAADELLADAIAAHLGSQPFGDTASRIEDMVHASGARVGWQGRFIGELTQEEQRRTPKYYTSPGMPKSRVLYNYDVAREYPFVVLVEGVTDVWRVGPPAVALLGKSPSVMQHHLLMTNWANKPIVLLLDPEARESTLKIVQQLRGSSSCGPIVRVTLPDGRDPADLDHAEVWSAIYQAGINQGIDLYELMRANSVGSGDGAEAS